VGTDVPHLRIHGFVQVHINERDKPCRSVESVERIDNHPTPLGGTKPSRQDPYFSVAYKST
jgi:hypothetical protein